MTYYQVQFKKAFAKEWEAFDEAKTSLLEANRALIDLLNDRRYYEYGGDPIEVVRIVSVVQHHDKVWRVKEVLLFKELRKDP